MPLSLTNQFEQHSWVSGGWRTPHEVQPFTPESEKKIVHTMISELNGLFDLELGSEPSCDRLVKEDKAAKRMLVIGGSHSIRESEALAKKGVEVISVAARGWRPNMTACEDMAANVAEAVKLLTEDDCVVIHCFDNIAFMARSEEGGTFLFASLHQEIIISKATLFWPVRNVSLCISETVLLFSSCWRSLRCSFYHLCHDTCTEPAAHVRTMRRTSGRTALRIA